MPNSEKAEKVRKLAERFRSAQGTLFSDYRGLTVKDAMELRTQLRQHDASFVVAKNTLTKLAAKEAGLEGVDDLLKGPTGIVFADGDPIAGAKAFMEVARRFPALQIKGAFMEGHVFDEEGAKGLATVEPREVSLAKIAGLLQSPLSRIAYLLQAPVQRIAYALAERGKQDDGTAPQAAPVPEAVAAEVPASEVSEAEVPEAAASEPEATEPDATAATDAAGSPEAEASAPAVEAVEADAATDTDTGSG